MSYRPLTITAPIYRCWATMRLYTMDDWISSWALPEMHAGVPELGAVDAWHKASTDIEEMKLDGTPFCGGVADIAKLFDQVRRVIVYRMAAVASMPPNILKAYTAYMENVLLYNCLAGGVGRPHKKKMRHPPRMPSLHDDGGTHHEAMGHHNESM